MIRSEPLQAVFYRTDAGNEPVRDWLKALSKAEKKLIGEDIKTAQYGWPVGMPVVRKLEKDIWEVRTELDKKIARVLITVHLSRIVLLYGFIKKSQRTPKEDIQLGRQRLKDLKEG